MRPWRRPSGGNRIMDKQVYNYDPSDIQNDANCIKWLMLDLMVDLVSAVSMARETYEKFQSGQITPEKAMGRLRVCNHSIVISLSKLCEIRKGYAKFFLTFPGEIKAPFFEYAKQIEGKGITKFRNKYAAHIFDDTTGKPISLADGERLLSQVFGMNNEDCLNFYDWIYDRNQQGGCIVHLTVQIKSHCLTLPGGDLERP